jgi:hypothetical protein
MTHLSTEQLGFDALLQETESDNRLRKFQRETAHLPDTMEAGLPYYRILIRQHHAAMLAANVDEAMRLRHQADLLARRLNDGEPGILAGPDAPGCVLERESAAAPGAVPLWGQKGEFIVTAGAMRVRVEIEGMFGIGSGFCYWPGFSAHAVDFDRPFLSETGYRSFLGIHADPAPNLTPDEFVRKVIDAHVARELKGRLLAIEARYHERVAP